MDKILEKQRKFFESGQTRPLEYRLKMLRTMREAILAFEKDIFDALHRDLGKPKMDAYATEIGHCLAEISLTLKRLKKWARPRRVGGSKLFPFSTGSIVPEPLGVSLILSPWNYPFNLAIAPLIASIAAGNCAIIKPSEVSKNTEQIIARMIAEYFDESFAAVVCGGPDAAKKLLDCKFDHIFFTGGETVGKIVMEAAAKHVTPVTLELGGKSPCFVDENCNLQRAAKRIAWGKFLNVGQTCVAPDYLLVHSNAKTALVKHLKETILKFYGEDPSKSPDYGRIINERHFDRLTGLLKDGQIILGAQTDRKELYISPTIVENVTEDAPLMNDEIFGPILPIVEFDDLSEAIRFVNSKPKPLALYVFSGDSSFQKRVISQTSSGSISINDTVVQLSASSLPFGGVGPSGFGRYHGKVGFDTFSNPKSLFRQTMLFDMPKRFPPTDNLGFKIFRKILK